MSRFDFPIPTECTKCGHRGDIFVDDDNLRAQLKRLLAAKGARIWAEFVVKRMIFVMAIMTAIGFAIGRWGR